MTEPGLSADFIKLLHNKIPKQRIFTDPLSLHAYAHDASHYLIIPQVVIRVETEAEISAVLAAARSTHFPITFRAAGTSLSGQALSAYALIVLGEGWRQHKILANGEIIYLEPGVIGSEANLFLNPYQRKIGPDPASLHSCKIGGIAANNASGLCCGIIQNSYHTLHGLRLILADGTLLDTHTAHSVSLFRKSHAALLNQLQALRQRILSNETLALHILRQYRVKNTLGYSLNALLDFEDPLEILTHLMIGSEGTLGFIAGISLKTIPCPPFESACLFFFENLTAACKAIPLLPLPEISALEIMDQAALTAGKVSTLLGIDLSAHPQHAALLLDLKTHSLAKRDELIRTINALALPHLIHRTEFIEDRALYHRIWDVRKGIFPSIAAMRRPGSALINEDVAVPLPYLPSFCQFLQKLFQKHHYGQNCIFGHAKDGNLHFLLEADFATPTGIAQYEAFMADLVKLVLHYQGALKAEHGTGRNMTHTVRQAFGGEAYQIMQEIKTLFDPECILNPDVILSDNPELHLQNLKQLPVVHPLIDTCIECGFCEKICPSKNLSLTPRQRIASLRDFSPNLPKDFQYRGLDTCAKTGLCEMACPVGINTGALVGAMQASQRSRFEHWIASWISRHFSLVSRLARWALALLHPRLLHRSQPKKPPLLSPLAPLTQVIYFPSCGERVLDSNQKRFIESLRTVLGVLRIELILAPAASHYCCGLAFQSKGFPDLAAQKRAELATYLNQLSENGQIPILTETASCIEGLPLRDVLDFLAEQLLPTDLLKPLPETILLHLTCSVKRQHLEAKILSLAQRCAQSVIVPADIACCGFAGDKGLSQPELNESALKTLKAQVPPSCEMGYSSSPSCELGLTRASGIPYRSLVYLIERSLLGS